MASHVTIGVNKETHKKLGKLASLTHRTRANTVEWLVEKAIKEPNSSPITVTIGIKIFFKIWTKTIRFSDKPLALAKVI